MDPVLATVRDRHVGWLLLAAVFAIFGVASVVTFLYWIVSAIATIPDWALVLARGGAAGLQIVNVVLCYWFGVGAWRRSGPTP